MSKGFKTTAIVDCATRKTMSVQWEAGHSGLIYIKRSNRWDMFNSPPLKQRLKGERRSYAEITPAQAVAIFRATAEAHDLGGGIL